MSTGLEGSFAILSFTEAARFRRVPSMVHCRAGETHVVTSKDTTADPQTRHDLYDLTGDGQVDVYCEKYGDKRSVIVNKLFSGDFEGHAGNCNKDKAQHATPGEACAAQVEFAKGLRYAQHMWKICNAAMFRQKASGEQLDLVCEGYNVVAYVDDNNLYWIASNLPDLPRIFRAISEYYAFGYITYEDVNQCVSSATQP